MPDFNYNYNGGMGGGNFSIPSLQSILGSSPQDFISFLTDARVRGQAPALAENARQFNAGLGFQGQQLGEQGREFDTGLGENARQFNVGAGFQGRQLDDAIKTAAIQRALLQRQQQESERIGINKRQLDWLNSPGYEDYRRWAARWEPVAKTHYNELGF